MVQDDLQETLPQKTIEILTMKTTGDKILNQALERAGGKGLFVKELDHALLGESVQNTVGTQLKGRADGAAGGASAASLFLQA